MITWEEFKTNKKYWIWAGIIIVVLCLICGGHDGRYEGRYEKSSQNVVAITGHGEVQAVPDVATIYYTVRKEAKTVAEAQTKLAEIVNNSFTMLRANGISDSDIKTESKSFNPKYEYVYLDTDNNPCNPALSYRPCPGKSVVNGYEAYQSTTVKIRKIDDAGKIIEVGKIIEELGKLGVTDLSGPNFKVEKEEGLKEIARNMAIDDAKTKAKKLAKELGVRLGQITAFSENGNYPRPMYQESDMMAKGLSSVASAPAELPVGENTISSDVTITYEIR